MATNYKRHPFVEEMIGTAFTNEYPLQRLSWKDKHAKKDKYGISAWMKLNMDFAETVARVQRDERIKGVINEKLVNGEMIDSVDPDLCEECEEDFSDIIFKLEADGDLPKKTKNYDMIGIPIKQQVSEFDQRPDTLTVKGYGEALENDRFAMQKEEVIKWAMEQVDLYIEYLVQNVGLSEEDQEFNSEEEAEQFRQYVEQFRESKTPEELGEYMSKDYRHFFEEWAALEKDDQEERFELRRLRRLEFYYYIIAGMRFRFLNITPDSFSVEELNYKDVYFEKDDNTRLVHYGNYAGFMTLESVASVINKDGHLLTEEQIKSLDYGFSSITPWVKARKEEAIMGGKVDYLSPEGLPYNHYLPHNTPFLTRIAPKLGVNWLTPSFYNAKSPWGDDPTKLYRIQHFWRSLKKVGRLAWTNPETGLFEVIEVDETFVVPDYVKVLKKGKFSDPVEPDTIIWTWKEELWEGKKLVRTSPQIGSEAIYYDIKPCEYQGGRFKYKNKPLPILGQVNYSPNLTPRTQVDIMKPYSKMFNLAMNKAYRFMELSYAAFLAIEAKTIPNHKDWGGNDVLFKWLESAQESQIAPVDTSSTASSLNSNVFPKVIDIDNTNKAIQAFNIANSIKMMAYEQIGFNAARLGDVSGINTASGVQEGLSKSFSATESWYTEFWEAETDFVTQQLRVAQWLQSNDRDTMALMSKGIMSESLLRNNTDEFELYDVRVYVSNSQENLRQLELFKRLALDNTTEIPMSTRMEISGATNARRIINLVKFEEQEAEKRRREIEDLQNRMAQEQNEIAKQKLAEELKYKYDELQNRLQVAAIRSYGFKDTDADNSGIPDVFEYQKFLADVEVDKSKLQLDKEKLNLARENEMNRRIEKQQELSLKQQDINQKAEEARLRNESAKYMDKGPYRG